MGFNFIFGVEFLKGTMINEFPQTFTFIFIDDWDSILNRPFDGRSFSSVFLKFWVVHRFFDVIVCVKVDWFIFVSKIHETVSTWVINEEGVVIIDLVIVVFIAAVRGYFKYKLGRKAFCYFNFECTFTSVGGFEDTPQIRL